MNEDFSEEVLNNVMAVLDAQTAPQVRPAGFLEEKEACDYSGNISRSTLWHWTKRGLRSYKVGGRRLYRPEDLNGFICSPDVAEEK